jgi:long-chain acyl-CoA synthetase
MRTFFDELRSRATSAGDRPALVSQMGTLRYSGLMDRVRRHAGAVARLPQRIGTLCAPGPDHLLCDLALSFAGKEMIPLPDFFSDAQLSHLIETTGLTDAVADPRSSERARQLRLNVHQLNTGAAPSGEPAAEASRVIFTSGTTGRPKGVCLLSRQMLASVAALREASEASERDRYLSILPPSLLLEQIAGLYVPLAAGATIYLPGRTTGPNADPGRALTFAVEQTGATATVLVPELVMAWLRHLKGSGARAPRSLRYVAVGGAPLSGQVADAAWECGIPVYEGYGLSECSSVVAVNRPNARRAGTVGRPVPNVGVEIDGGEIVVAGPTLMNGYVGEQSRPDSWRTGDLGHFDEDGFLIVTGRKDNVIVTSSGRNINPEWIEQVIGADSRLKRCVVVEYEHEIAALVVPADCRLCRDFPAMREVLDSAVRELPDYAKPRRYLALSDQEFRSLDLMTANLRPRRAEAHRLLNQRCDTLHLQTR